MAERPKALFCSLASPGWVYPQVGIAKKLLTLGYDCAFVTGKGFETLLDSESFTRFSRGKKDGPSFDVSVWHQDLHIAIQVKHVEYALRTFDASVLVTSQLALGPMIVAERFNIPLVVLGMAAYLFPRVSRSHAKPTPAVEARRQSNYLETLKVFNSARALFKLTSLDGFTNESHMLGDLFLLQSVAAACMDDILPPQVAYVGAVTWEPDIATPELDTHLSGARESGRDVYYLSPGRLFGASTGLWSIVASVLSDEPIVVFTSTARMDDPFESLPSNFVAFEYIPQGRILSHAKGVISTGHPASVLGAFVNGLPLLLLPNGSGTFDTAEVCERLGCAIIVEPADVVHSPQIFREAFHMLSTDEALKRRGELTGQLFSPFDGALTAAKAIDCLLSEWTEAPAPVKTSAYPTLKS